MDQPSEPTTPPGQPTLAAALASDNTEIVMPDDATQGRPRALDVATFPDMPLSSGALLPQGNPIGPTDDGPRNYTRPDAFILDDVARLLAWEPAIDAFDLEIACDDGTVTVSGTVPGRGALKRLEELVASVFAVRELSLDGVAVDKGIASADSDSTDVSSTRPSA